MHANVRLLGYGLLIGVLSTLYPRLPSYLPHSISSRLPFLSHTILDPTLSKTWQSVQRYQQTVPISKNYEYSSESRWEEEIERQLRFGSKEGGREMEKEMKRLRRELEKRSQEAGMENHIKEGLPVYFVEQDLDGENLSRVGSEINSILPQSVVLVAPYPTTSQHLLISTSSLDSIHSPSPKLSQYLLNAFAHHPPSGVPAVPSSTLAIPSQLERIVEGLSLDREIKLSFIALPVSKGGEDQGNDGWSKEQWWDVGEVLHELRHGHEGDGEGVGGKRTVVLGIGKAVPDNASPSFLELLHSSLTHHTSHHRTISLSSLYSSSASGLGKPTKIVPRERVGLVVSVEAGGEGEGEVVEGTDGKVWRFGALPIR